MDAGNRQDMKYFIIAGAVVLAILLTLFAMGYTKAQNDQEYYEVVGSEMSEEQFAEFMDDEQMRRHGG